MLVTLVFAFLLSLVRGTRAEIILRGMILLIIIVSVLTLMVDLPAFSWLVRTTLPALLVAIPVIFAPEIRRALERLGTAVSRVTITGEPAELEQTVKAIVSAAKRLSDQRYGALIVLERETPLDDYAETGERLDAHLSSEILQQIFYPNTPLHDGAAMIRGDRVLAAACVMPLSSSGTVARPLERATGLRHRAALGISEVSDAVSVVVSEETGDISVTHNGRMIRRLDESRLRNILIAFNRPQTVRWWPGWFTRFATRIGRYMTRTNQS
ncbi:MAG: TIGR00159 family protein [Anaerolineales bacterium]|nr:TIGR00159 family protein [Anaerolineales bacterium]